MNYVAMFYGNVEQEIRDPNPAELAEAESLAGCRLTPTDITAEAPSSWIASPERLLVWCEAHGDPNEGKGDLVEVYNDNPHGE